MRFDEKYQLLELADDEGVETFVAKEIATGKVVRVFLFVREQVRDQRELFRQLREIDRTRFPELIETGDNRGTPYVVTEPISSLAELKNRLSRLNAASPEPQAHKTGEFSKAGVWHVPADLKPPLPPSTKVSPETFAPDGGPEKQSPANTTPGSFTQMFQAPATSIGKPAPEAPKEQAPPPGTPPAQHAPGEFTQMFQAVSAPASESALETSNSPATAPPSTSARGEFTQMFQTADPMGEPAPQAPKAFASHAPPLKAQHEPWGFTRFFSAASPSAPMPVPQKPESQGEFSRVFGSDDRITSPPSTVTGMFSQPSTASAPRQEEIPVKTTPPSSHAQSAGEFTRIFGDTASDIPAMGSTVPPPSTIAPPPPPSSPGEYTRIFSAPPNPQEHREEPLLAPGAASETPVPPKQPSKLVLMLIGIILLLLAIIAILLVTSR